MIPANPGNLLPFYPIGYSFNDLRYQRHRLPGQDLYRYGIPAPRTRLLPFQIFRDVAFDSVLSFVLFNAEDDTTSVILDTALLEVSQAADLASFWVTWKADTDLDVIPDCGNWYVFLNLGDAGVYYSEVMSLEDFCGFEKVGLSIGVDSCAIDGSAINFQLVADVEAGSGTTWSIQRKVGLTWSEIATGSTVSVSETLSNEARDFRIVATTACGLIITQTYNCTWDSADGCGTLTLGSPATSTNEAGILSTPPLWRLNISHSTDKANVLYQTGYEQYLYLPTVIWDVPEVNREIETQVNGNGEEIRRFTRTVERRGFEIPDVPDYVLGFLQKAGDHDTIEFEDAKLVSSLQPVSFQVENLTFETSGRQGPSLNIGRFYFDVEAEAFQGCQENFVLD